MPRIVVDKIEEVFETPEGFEYKGDFRVPVADMFHFCVTDARRRDEPTSWKEQNSPSLRLHQESYMQIPGVGLLKYSHKRKSVEEIGKVVSAKIEFRHLEKYSLFHKDEYSDVREKLVGLGFEKKSERKYQETHSF